MDVTTTIINEIIYTFLQLIQNLDTFLHAIMKTWALCCMLQWKLGHFVACYNENLGSFFHLLKQFFVHFFACNKEIYGTFIFATKQIFLWRHPSSIKIFPLSLHFVGLPFFPLWPDSFLCTFSLYWVPKYFEHVSHLNFLFGSSSPQNQRKT